MGRTGDKGTIDYYKPLVLWLVMVAIISLAPITEEPVIDFPHSDKVMHFVLYAITGMLILTFLLESNKRHLRVFAPVLAVLLAAAYGLLMEYLQRLAGHRDFSWLDEAANTAGAIAGVAFATFTRKR